MWKKSPTYDEIEELSQRLFRLFRFRIRGFSLFFHILPGMGHFRVTTKNVTLNRTSLV